MAKSGIAFHCHHDKLYEEVYDFDERVNYIKHNKPLGEQELRLRLFQLIPDNLLPRAEARKALDKAWEASAEAQKALVEAWKAYAEARKALDKAWEASAEAQKALVEARKARVEAWKACDEAWKARDEARKALDKAWEAYVKLHDNDIKKLHAELCPDCPWDGTTIFTKKGE